MVTRQLGQVYPKPSENNDPSAAGVDLEREGPKLLALMNGRLVPLSDDEQRIPMR